MDDLLKDAIADAKAVRETAITNAKLALEEAFTPKLQNMLSQKIQNEVENEGMHDDDEEALGTGQDHPVEECGHGQDHLRRDLPRARCLRDGQALRRVDPGECLGPVQHRRQPHHRFRRIRSGLCDQVHHPASAPERQPGRSGHFRRAAICAAAGCGCDRRRLNGRKDMT